MNIKISIVIWTILFSIFSVTAAMAQVSDASFSSSPNPLGSGARALGLGNAFIAVADDATAASWNPGGLMQLETPEVSLVLSYSSQAVDYTFSLQHEADRSNHDTTFDLNYFSAAYPFAIFGKNMIVSLNYQRLYDLNLKQKFNFRKSTETSPDIEQRINFSAEGGLKALSPAYAIQITEDLSFGFALNFWADIMGGRNGWKEEYRERQEGSVGSTHVIRDIKFDRKYEDMRGFNFNLGTLWNITERITLGAIFKSPFKAEMDHSYVFRVKQELPTNIIEPPSITDDRVKLNFPLSYGAGLAFRFSDEFTFAFDVYRTEWGNYYFTADDGSKTSPIDGRPRSESHIKATTQVHLGAEYLFILEKTVVPVRGGIFYDPEPSEGTPEDFYGFSLGSGISIGNTVIDAAYQYRWGNNAENISLQNTEKDVTQHKFYLSVIYHF